jgi:2-dehydro-3-deoxyphosphogluconate aldolase/(4S)-4-hydroxy-2-oxoglutarate aldolase
MLLAAGTVTNAAELELVRDAGAQLAVSPGLSAGLTSAARRVGFPLIPGVTTPSEVMTARDAGFDVLKLFPAAVAGGPDLLRALASPFADVRFCPTGGIGADDFRDYLALGNVVCVGGSWLAPRKLVAARDWDEITRIARATWCTPSAGP